MVTAALAASINCNSIPCRVATAFISHLKSPGKRRTLEVFRQVFQTQLLPIMKFYPAPWSKSVIFVSAFVTLVILGTTVGLVGFGHGIPRGVGYLPLAILLFAVLFLIRGYTVGPDAILVHRLFWVTRLPLKGLQSAKFDPEAMRRSIRLCGNGGLFSVSGFYRNQMLGTFRAFVTDPHRAVILHYSSRTVVISPAAPEEFVRDLVVTGRAAA